MLLTKPQTQRFWREWTIIKRQLKAAGSTDAQCENERYDMLQRAGFNSLTEVDTRAGFDAVLAQLGLMREDIARTAETLPAETIRLPAGEGTTKTKDTPGYRRRILYLVRKHSLALGGEPYVLALARDRFGITEGLRTIEDLATDKLHQLMITLNSREHTRKKKAQRARRSCASQCPSVPVRGQSVSAPAIASELAACDCESVPSVPSVPCPVSVEDPF
jgi:hypothetical protein